MFFQPLVSATQRVGGFVASLVVLSLRAKPLERQFLLVA